MQISKSLALIIGLATIWPLVYILGFMVSVGFLFAQEPASSPSGGDPFRYLIALHLVTMLVIVGLLVFYLAHVFKNGAFRDDRRTLWAVVLFMGAPISMPVYW